MSDKSWQEQSECVGIPTQVFFPENGEYKSMKFALSICNKCSVKDICLSENINETIGIFGGTTGKQRQRLRIANPVTRECLECNKPFPANRSHTICSELCKKNRRIKQKRKSANNSFL